MLIIRDINNKNQKEIELCQFFVNTQILENDSVDMFVELNFLSDDDYSNFDNIRLFFNDYLGQNQKLAAYDIVDTNVSEEPIVRLRDGYIKSLGINALSTTPKIAVSFDTVV
jgi:hypothetical protein